MRIALFILVLTLRFYTAEASISNPMYGCDTLITTSGQVLLVHLESSNDSLIKFRYCGESTGELIEKKTSLVREIRRAPVQQNRIPEGAEVIVFDDQLPRGSELKNLALKEKQITLNAQLAALFGVGSIFLWLFSVVFSPWVLLLVIPFFIAGFTFSIKTLRKTKGKTHLQKQRTLGIVGLTCSILQLSVILFYLLLFIYLFLTFF